MKLFRIFSVAERRTWRRTRLDELAVSDKVLNFLSQPE
jgi:hypothetical protein